MDYLRSLVAVCLLASGSAYAGYAQLANPSGFSGSPGGWTFAPSANDLKFGNVVHQSNGLRVPVPGVSATMPASYRFAANAPRIAAAAIFLSPHLRAAVGIASWLAAAAVVWDAASGTWKTPDSGAVASTGRIYSYVGDYSVTASSGSGACAQFKSFHGSNFISSSYSASTGICTLNGDPQVNGGQPWSHHGQIYSKADAACPTGWFVTPAGCVQTPPMKQLTEKEMSDLLNPDNHPGWPNVPADWPMPETVPFEIPGVPFPVNPPFINPSPGPNPVHRPLFVPTGNPLPNPKYDPNAAPGPGNQPYYQPGVRVVPSPTPDNPFRVDIIPVDRPQDSLDPDPNPNPDTPPDPNNPDKPKPEEQQSLCEKHPEVVACQKLGSLNPEVLAKKAVPLTITREDGFGPADGACPAPKTFVVMGKPMAFKWDLLCDFASQIRPLLVGFAYLSAALAFMGLARKD